MGGRSDFRPTNACACSSVLGIREKDLHRLVALCRKTAMEKALLSSLAPTSEKWILEQLLFSTSDQLCGG